MKHHPDGPSTLDRRWKCPGSGFAERGLPDIPNADSREGQALHDAVWRSPESNQVLTSEQQSVLYFAQKDLDQLAVKYQVDEWAGESRVSIYDKDGEEITFGTCDSHGIGVFKDKNTIVLADFKFGRKEVDQAKDNLQLSAYALGLYQMYGIEKVVAKIIQPRVSEKQKEFTFTAFDAIRDLISFIIRQANH